MGKTCDEKCVYSVSLEFGSDVNVKLFKNSKMVFDTCPFQGFL